MDTCTLKVKSRASGKFWYLASEQEINVKKRLIMCCLFYFLWALSISFWSCWNTFLQLEYLTQFSSPHWKRSNVKVCMLHSIRAFSSTKRMLLPPVLLLWHQISKIHLFRIDIASYFISILLVFVQAVPMIQSIAYIYCRSICLFMLNAL